MSAGPGGYVGRTMRRLASYTHTFICISDYVKRLITGYGVPEEKCRRIHCATDTQVTKDVKSSLKDELNLPAESPVIGTTGIWRPNKGFPYFISACERISKRHPMARFLLGGRAYTADSAYATTLWMRGRMLRALGMLHFTGFVEDVGKFLSALDVFVLPSDCEPFGLVLIEAMARGIPVIATNAGGVPEIVTHLETGILVPPKDPAALAQALDLLLSQPLLRMQLGEAARLRARAEFDRRVMIRRYEELYQGILEETA